MPVYSRRYLRQTLGKSYIRDTVTGLTTGTFGYGSGNLAFLAAGVLLLPPFGLPVSKFADPSQVGQGLYQNSTVYHLASEVDYRVSSFNAGSGAFVSSQIAQMAISFGDEFEVHSRLSGTEKNQMIDDVIGRIKVRQEVGIPTGTGGQDFFSIETAGSPNYVVDVLDAYWFANPTGSLDRGMARFTDIRIVTTATGREIRVAPAPGGSTQIILDAILTMTLGATSTATINIPNDRWVLAGAALGCYNLMIQAAPGQNAGNLVDRRNEWAREFSRLSSRWAPEYTRKVRLEDPEDQTAFVVGI